MTDAQASITLNQIQAGQTINWAAQEAALQPANVTPAAWNTIWTNFQAEVGSTTDSYNAALAQAATYLGGLGESTAQVSNIGRLFSFLVSQADAAFPAPTLSTAVDASLPTPGALSLAIDRTFHASIGGRSNTGIFGLGWTTSWESTLSVDAGNVSINTGGGTARFVLQPNGTYLNTAGEFGTLTFASGLYSSQAGRRSRSSSP